MSLELCVLASGSSGNCSVLRTPAGVVLIDAGLGPVNCAKRMYGTGVHVRDISAICLTHLDADHFSSGWTATLLRRGIVVHCHAHCVEQLVELAGDEAIRPLIRGHGDSPFEPIAGLAAQPIALTHDQKQCHAFVFEAHGRRVGFATDLGHVPDMLIERFVDLDVLAIESNYDPQMQIDSERPIFLKNRIMGGRGHLSNEQALAAIRRVLDRAQRRAIGLPNHIVLLHRSRFCNCPKLVMKLFNADARIAPRLVLSEQFSRTEWLSTPGRHVTRGEQLLLWG